MDNKATNNISDDNLLYYSCSICNLRTNDIEKLEFHVRRHFREKTFSCCYCSSNYNILHKLTLHMLYNHNTMNEFIYSCRYCNLQYKNINDLIQHEIHHQPENSECQITEPFDCSNCGSTFKTNPLVIDHKNNECGINNNDDDNDNDGINCSICKKKFAFINDLNLHERIHNNLILYQCKFCCKYFKRIKEFLDHVRLMHIYELNKQDIILLKNKNAENNQKLIENLQFDEDSLKKDVLESTSSETILKNHDLKRSHKCPICSLSFVQEVTLKIHCRHNHPNIDPDNIDLIKFKEKSKKCSICNEKFPMHTEFLTHLLNVHNGRKPYKCSICLLNFTRSTTLYEHSDYHKAKYTICKYCNEILKKDKLNEHLKIHEGILIIKCPVCDIPFTDCILLENHGIIHSRDITPSCIICNKEFLTINEMEIHVDLHEQLLNIYKCSICRITFKTQNLLINHMKKHNSDAYSDVLYSADEEEFDSKKHLIKQKERKRHLVVLVRDIDKKEYTCEVCSETFLNKTRLHHHLVTNINCNRLFKKK